ncbi:MAG: hypothetical protein U0457_21825 [Candidatus Sericytochromatia bacterium]
MKVKEFLDSQINWSSVPDDLKQVIFSKINHSIIELLDSQESFDLPAFIQKIANILSDENKKKLVSTINYLIKEEKVNSILDNIEQIHEEKLGDAVTSKLADQLSNSIKVQVTEEIKDKLKEAISQTVSDQISEVVSNTLSSGNINTSNFQSVPHNSSLGNTSASGAASSGGGVGTSPLNPDDEYIIDEMAGAALGIVLGRTNKTEVLSIMRKYSTKFSNNATLNVGKQVNYDDVSLTVMFNDQKIVKGLTFGKNYRGKTSKGLKTGDNVNRAIELYGQPQYKTPYSCVWQEMAVFCDEPNVISSIRLQI